MWKRRRLNGAGLDARLRSFRAQSRDEFVNSLSERLAESVRTTPRAWSRVAFAGAVSVFILGTLASFGGLSYAASGTSGAYHAAKQVAVHRTFFVTVHKSSAADEYPKPPKHHKKKHHHGASGVEGAVASPRGTLPFTGVSLLATLILSLALIAAGVALRRGERRRSN